MKFTNEHILECRKRNYFILLFGVLLIILGSVVVFLSINQNSADEKNIQYLNDIIEQSSDKNGKKAYVDVKYISSAFAVYNDTTDAYYYVSDGNYYYIVFLKADKYSELSEMDLINNPYKLVGITRGIRSDVMNIAIEEWNENLEDDYEPLDSSSFYDVYGDVYLDQTASYGEIASLYNSIAYLVFVVGIIASVFAIFRIFRFNSRIKKFDGSDIDSIEAEMSASDAFYYKGIKLCLTRSYIIVLGSQFSVYKYSDILWMYPYEQRYNGIKTNTAIKIFTRDGRTSMIASISIATKTQKAIYNEVWDSIIEKNPSIVLGYDNEKVRHFNEVRKEIYKNKKNGI